MSVIKDLICTEEDGTLSFGNYELAEKAKRSDYEHDGDLYKVKTFAEITKLEKNGMFVYESVPGTAVHHFHSTANGVSFEVEGRGIAFRKIFQWLDLITIFFRDCVMSRSQLMRLISVKWQIKQYMCC